ncbi:MAG: hypothetical protein HY607_02025 [Planctomycetes bacterium]|nr:hypothetical protein [Planctomycetota bacterium]MBI4221448.1 hypothetical protein [Planctomycetota bacterium]
MGYTWAVDADIRRGHEMYEIGELNKSVSEAGMITLNTATKRHFQE